MPGVQLGSSVSVAVSRLVVSCFLVGMIGYPKTLQSYFFYLALIFGKVRYTVLEGKPHTVNRIQFFVIIMYRRKTAFRHKP